MSATTIQVEAIDEEATRSLAKQFTAVLKPGDVVALDGPLGAGKTRFVQGVAEALGSERSVVNSPTFGLVQHYEARLPLVHIDAYRLRDCDEFEELGGAELFDPSGVTLIEWAGRIAEALPREHWRIAAEHTGESERRFTIQSTHRDREARMKQLAAFIGGPGS